MSIIFTRTWDRPGNPAPDGAPRRQFKIDYDVAGCLFAIAGAGLWAVKHLDGKIDDINQKFDTKFDGLRRDNNEKFDGLRRDNNEKFDGVNQKFDGVNQKFDGVNQKFDGINQKFDGVHAAISNLTARLERQYGFEEGLAKSVRVNAPPSSGTGEGVAS
jgi:hypothetical protein